MVRKKLMSVLALLVAMMLVLQVAPMYSFAVESGNEEASVAEQQNETDNSDGSILNFAIDSDGNRIDLPDEVTGADDDLVATPEPVSGALFKADSESFYQYDEDEVSLAAEKVVETVTFDNAAEGDTAVEGWTITQASKSGLELLSTIAVESTDRGNALKFEKVKNLANTKDDYTGREAGDEALYAFHDLNTPMQGVIAITADVKVEAAGRLGLFFYGKSDNLEEAVMNQSVPYLGRVYLWDNGSEDKSPSTTTPNGVAIWNNATRRTDSTAKYSLDQWYTVRYDIDTETGKYSYSLTDENGEVVASKSDISLNLTNLADADQIIYGVGFEVMNDTTSLGTALVNNIRVIDNNSAKQDAEDVAADAASLSLPNGLDATSVKENFSLPLTGSKGSAITWTSSDETVASVDNRTGSVTIKRPEFSGAITVPVNLTAHLEKGPATAEKNFMISVLEMIPETDKEKAEGDSSLLGLPEDLPVGKVSENFEMPLKGTFGSVITYTSSNEEIAKIDNTTGVVTITKPKFTGVGAVPVVITATITSGSESVTKELEFAVVENAPVTDEEKVIYDVNNAFVGGIDTDNVRQESFPLSDKGTYGTLTWSSSDISYIKVEENYDEIITNPGDDEGNSPETTVVRDGYKAIVTRPNRNSSSVKVVLTVTATLNGKQASKDFELTVVPEDALKAYPGVEGYGAYSVGGRGGKVYHVTTLAHDGEGSLKYGLEEVQGARTIVFDVGGVIDLTPLEGAITIRGEKYSNVTIAGQTAPYPGITLKGYGLSINSAHDVIVRNIKIRIGDVLGDGEYYQSDPLSIGSSRNVIIDHCSFEWAIDMAFRATGEYITMTNSIFAKSILGNSPHEKGGHAYIGMINEGARKVTYSKNYIGDSTQRSPRITDADWVDSYNCLLYNCGNGYDLFNYEWQNKNAKMNVYNNYARSGPSLSNATPYRMGRGREYSGGIMAYYAENYTGNAANESKLKPTLVSQATMQSNSVRYVLNYGKENFETVTIDNKKVTVPTIHLTDLTLDEWNADPRSYDNNGKTSPGATFTYMTNPFPAPRGEVLPVYSYDSGSKTYTNNIVEYAMDDNGMGATKPARDLYDTMILKEMKLGGTYNKMNLWSLKAKLTEEEVSPYFEELEKRTGKDYSPYKTAREWYAVQGGGPVLKGAVIPTYDSKGAQNGWSFDPKPVHWDDYTDVNVNTNPQAAEKYEEKYVTNFEVGDWWGEYCGSPGQQTTYTLYDNVLDRTVITTDENYDVTRYSLIGEDTSYLATERTVSDLVPADWVVEGYPEIAAFMDKYREENYPGMTDPDDDRYNPSYKIAWDGMADGIPNWYKEYRGWDTKQYLASKVDQATGYTYLEEYIQFMADDQPLETDDDPVTFKDFKVNNLGYSTAQVYWNTDYRSACVLEYGTEPGVYTNKEVLVYDETTDYYHTYHAQTLVDLEPNTQYYYKVTATDENSAVTVAEYDPNDALGKTMTFKTTEAPAGAADILPDKPTITNKVPYLQQVRLNWTGNVATDESYEIYYDTVNHGTSYEKYANKLTGIDARTNKQVITGLTNNKMYYFLLVAVNSNGRTASDVVSEIPSGRLLDFDFTKMSEEERNRYMEEEFMYVLGGNVTMETDPDTGEYVLQLLDETNSHGVNADNKLARTQDQKFTYEITMKILYQKQTDALNRQASVIEADGLPEHNTVQLNFYKDALPSEDMDSTNSALWEAAFSIFFDSQSKPISETNKRYDGTVESNTLKFASTACGSYVSGKTPGASEGVARTLPSGTGYGLDFYAYTTKYGDAIFSDPKMTEKTLHGLWYYQLGSAEFVTYKIVIDPEANNVKVYANNVAVYETGEFSEDIDEPYNIGKVQIKSRNDGYSWVNVASLRAYTGDTYVSPDDVEDDYDISKDQTPSAPVGGGIVGATGSGLSGGSYPSTNPTATPSATAEPGATSEPAPTINPETNKYFNDLTDVQWAVEPINTLAELGIVNGTAEKIYSPNANVTRAEYVAMLIRAFGGDAQPAETVQFADVQSDEWYYEPIAKAVSLGVINGYSVDGEMYFGVNDNISREDMMVMAYRTLNTLGVTIPVNKSYENFADQSSISDYAVEAIEKMYCAEIINGVGGNMLDPKGAADRAQSAKITYGLLKMEGTVNE